MAEDKKPQNGDDWDKLPLDPGADDWDDIPPPLEKNPRSSASTPLEKVSPAELFEKPEPDDQASGGGDAPAPDDGFDSPSPAEAADDGFDSPPPAEAELPPAAESQDELEEDDDGFAVVESAGAAPEQTADDEEVPLPNVSEPKPPTKKVELDIEGMDFHDEEEEAAEPEAAEEGAGPEKADSSEAPAEAPAEAEPSPGKRSRLKLLLIVLPVVLVTAALGFGAYKLFLAEPEPKYVPPPLSISPDLPAFEPSPGEMRLDSFYISFPGRPDDTIIELSMILHYNNAPDLAAINGRLTVLRDVIYRVTQGKGSLIITDSALQGVLREELRGRINNILGGDRVSYVQINQIRILQ